MVDLTYSNTLIKPINVIFVYSSMEFGSAIVFTWEFEKKKFWNEKVNFTLKFCTNFENLGSEYRTKYPCQ